MGVRGKLDGEGKRQRKWVSEGLSGSRISCFLLLFLLPLFYNREAPLGWLLDSTSQRADFQTIETSFNALIDNGLRFTKRSIEKQRNQLRSNCWLW